MMISRCSPIIKDPQDSVIINCTHDIEEINTNLYSENVFQGSIGDNFLPKGYQWKLECPVISNKLKKIEREVEKRD